MPKAVKRARPVRFLEKKAVSVGLAPGIAALDIIDPEASSMAAMAILSSTEKSMPGVCWPSRNVVSNRVIFFACHFYAFPAKRSVARMIWSNMPGSLHRMARGFDNMQAGIGQGLCQFPGVAQRAWACHNGHAR